MVESMPLRLLRRELGWNSQQRSDYKKLLCSLHCREEDRISLTRNSLTLDSQDDINPIYDIEFSPINQWLNIVAAADEKGFLTLVNTHEGAKNKYKIVDRHRCHGNAMFTASWSPHKVGLIATGSADLSIKLWDASNSFQMLRQYVHHTRTVKTIKFHPNQSGVFLSGSRDGSIMLWDSRTGIDGPENVIESAHLIESAHNFLFKKKVSLSGCSDTPVTDVLFKDDNTIVSCGSSDGYIKFWDIRKTYKYLKKKEPVRKISYPFKNKSCVGFSALCLDELNNLYAASACTEIFKFNLSNDSDNPESCFLNNANMQFVVKIDVSRDGRFLVAGSMNSFAHIWDTWDTEAKDPFTYLEGQSLDCTLGCAIFCPADPLTLVTGADDSCLMIWRVNNLKSHYKKSNGCIGSDSLPKAPLDSLRMKQNQDLRSIIPLYRRSQVAQVVGTWTSTPRTEGIGSNGAPISTAFNLCSLLSDLPNSVIDGRMCHLPERTHSAVSKRHTWLGNFVASEREKDKRSSNSCLKETPPKRLKTKHINSNSSAGSARERETESCSLNSTLKETPPKIPKTRNSNSNSSTGNLHTPPRKSLRANTTRTASGVKRKGEHLSPGTQIQCGASPPSILKYFTAPLRTSNLSTTETEC